MANKHRATIHFKSGKYGWTENYFLDTGGDLDTTLLKAELLAGKRAPLCGVGVMLDYIVVSDEAVKNDSAISDKRIYVIGTGFSPPPNSDPSTTITVKPAAGDEPADLPPMAILVRLESPQTIEDPIQKKHRANLYMRGTPDSQLVNPPGPAITTGWGKAFGAWVDQLKAGPWRFEGVEYTVGDTTWGINEWTLNAGGTATLKLGFHSLVVGDRVRVSKAKVSTGRYRANRDYLVVSVVANDTITVLGADGRHLKAALGTTVNGGQVVKVTPVKVYPKIDRAIVRGETTRRTGRPFDSPVGRRSVGR